MSFHVADIIVDRVTFTSRVRRVGGTSAMVAQICFVSPSGRGAIPRGRYAVTAWRLERSQGRLRQISFHILSGFCIGWISCFFWLVLPTLVYEH